MKNIISKVSLLTLLVYSAASQAIDIDDSAQVHGFVSQGYVYSPENPYAGKNSLDGSFDFREIGLNGSWEATDKLRFAGQLLSRKKDEAADGSILVDFLLADYLAYSDSKSSFGVRIGRIKNPLGFYNAVRDIPSSRPGINVPSSVYFDSFRDVVLATDGLSLYGSFALDTGDLNWNVYAGNREMSGMVMEHYVLGKNVQGKFDNAEIKGLNLTYSLNTEQPLTFGFSLLHVKAKMNNTKSPLVAQQEYGYALFSGSNPTYELSTNYANYVTGASVDSVLALASVQYGYQNWLFTAEYLNVFNNIDVEVLGKNTSIKPVSEGFYLQAEWFATRKIHALARYEELYLVDKNKMAADPNRPNNPYHSYSKGLTFGLKWLINPNLTLAGEVTSNEGNAWLPVFDGEENYTMKKYWNTYSMQLTYQF
ncbi:hypothetical protein [Thiomicrorhabdus sp.]|uniref:hypothetical protein n=1 Tax=Thiomicrorhabdus sp. TaxID=2039724 RepID=UPI002AA789E2|nr:hypothetical protein [Thiomicrorhabdus sp.]